MPMPLIPDMAVFQRKLATLPLATYQAGETVLSAASTTGRLLILKEGAVAVVKEGVEIARVAEPGAVFGELSVLLDQPHTADVRALEASQFHVTDAAAAIRRAPEPLARPMPPLTVPVKKRDTTWVEPRFDAEITYSEITNDGMVRQPSFRALLRRR
jgi:hypothetical protein